MIATDFHVRLNKRMYMQQIGNIIECISKWKQRSMKIFVYPGKTWVSWKICLLL